MIVIEFNSLNILEMTFFDTAVFLLYGIAAIFIIYFILGFFYQPQQTIIYNEEVPVVYQEPIWPWWGGYNYWPNWFPWGYGGGYGGGYYGRRWGPGRRWDGGHRWHGGSTRPYGGGPGRGANVGAPRSGIGGGRMGGRGGDGGRR
jgi:hypothetical protein